LRVLQAASDTPIQHPTEAPGTHASSGPQTQ